MYDTKDREPPIAIYVSELIHSKTRDLGIGNSAVDTFERDGVVAPLFLEKDLFCTTAVDDIDINPSSVTATDSFHGTAASVNQHPVIDSGVKRTPVTMSYDTPRLKRLPEDYTEVTPFQLPERVCPP